MHQDAGKQLIVALKTDAQNTFCTSWARRSSRERPKTARRTPRTARAPTVYMMISSMLPTWAPCSSWDPSEAARACSIGTQGRQATVTNSSTMSSLAYTLLIEGDGIAPSTGKPQCSTESEVVTAAALNASF